LVHILFDELWAEHEGRWKFTICILGFHLVIKLGHLKPLGMLQAKEELDVVWWLSQIVISMRGTKKL
jgi:hypothetical protein